MSRRDSILTTIGFMLWTVASCQVGRAMEGGRGKLTDIPGVELFGTPTATPAGSATPGAEGSSQTSFTADSTIDAFNLRDGNGNRLSPSALLACPVEPEDWCFRTESKVHASIPLGLKPDAVDGDPCQDGVTYQDQGGEICFDAATFRPGMRR